MDDDEFEDDDYGVDALAHWPWQAQAAWRILWDRGESVPYAVYDAAVTMWINCLTAAALPAAPCSGDQACAEGCPTPSQVAPAPKP